MFPVDSQQFYSAISDSRAVFDDSSAVSVVVVITFSVVNTFGRTQAIGDVLLSSTTVVDDESKAVLPPVQPPSIDFYGGGEPNSELKRKPPVQRHLMSSSRQQRQQGDEAAAAAADESGSESAGSSTEAETDDEAEEQLRAGCVFTHTSADQPSSQYDFHVSFCATCGDRVHMEDVCVHAHNYFAHCPSEAQRRPFHYFGIFDGHGGRHASEFASNHLLDFITQEPGFWRLDDDSSVMQAIFSGFHRCHHAMWQRARQCWPTLPSGHRSTAGTTASIAILREAKLYVGHVGDSGIVISERSGSSASSPSAVESPESPMRRGDSTTTRLDDGSQSHRLTDDHKPEDREERERIESVGGSVRCKQSVYRVVWKRPLLSAGVPDPRSVAAASSTQRYSFVPFLAVARSLGDFWSYSHEHNDFTVSPTPDVSVFNLDWPRHRALIIGSDGLWNIVKAEEAVQLVVSATREICPCLFIGFCR